MAEHNYSSSNHLMYYSHPTSQPDNTMNQILSSSTPTTDTYYAHSLPGSAALSMIPTTSDMKSIDANTMQPLPLSLISNPPSLVAPGQVFDQQQQQQQQQHQHQHQHQQHQLQQHQLQHQHHHHQQQQQQHLHHQQQDLGALQDTSLYSDPSSVVDEDVSSRASSSMSGNRTGQEAYIMQLQKQLDESKHLQTQYYYRIEQLMALVEKQTARISELQEQLTHGGYTAGTVINGSQPIQQPIQQDQQQQLPPEQHHHHLPQQPPMQQFQQLQQPHQQHPHHH